ncbi:aspartate aminotransferase family protein, partial [Bacillus spizizenii]|nr:aspartate aminotransferase family protein [Bacillus spizizenii]
MEMMGMENIQQNQGLKQKEEQFVWHAMKGVHQADSLIALKAEGAWVTDIDGRRYLDAMSGLWF